MVGSARKNWPPYLAEGEPSAEENPAGTGEVSDHPGECHLVAVLNKGHEEVALGPGLECFWFPDATYFFLVKWSSTAGGTPNSPPGLTRGEGGEERCDDTGRSLEEKHAGKRSRDGSLGAAKETQKGDGGIHSPRDDGSDPSGSRQRRRKEQAGKEQGKNVTQSQDGSTEVPVTTREWPEYPDIGGESARAGKLPKYVGMIAFMGWGSQPSLDDLYVCVVVKGTGLETFPRGTTKPKNPMLVSALRMWYKSTGINAGRVQPQRCIHVDDEKHSCRYIVTECDWQCRYGRHKQPDSHAWEWPAPYRASNDTDPIVCVRWSRVSAVVQGTTKVPASRVELLKQALRLRAIGHGWWPQGHLAQGLARWQGEPTSRDNDAEPEAGSAKNARPAHPEGGKGGVGKEGVDQDGAAGSANWKYLAESLERRSAGAQPSGESQP